MTDITIESRQPLRQCTSVPTPCSASSDTVKIVFYRPASCYVRIWYTSQVPPNIDALASSAMAGTHGRPRRSCTFRPQVALRMATFFDLYHLIYIQHTWETPAPAEHMCCATCSSGSTHCGRTVRRT
jgi:hypothetical protein